jgi:hypothetical protein
VDDVGGNEDETSAMSRIVSSVNAR